MVLLLRRGGWSSAAGDRRRSLGSDSEVGHAFGGFAVAAAVHGDGGHGVVEFAQLGVGQVEVGGADVLLEGDSPGGRIARPAVSSEARVGVGVLMTAA
jgi:hypothetical protein